MGPSTGAPWPRCTPPANRPSTKPFSPCPRASATSLGKMSGPSTMRSRPKWRRCCSSRFKARVGYGRPARSTSRRVRTLCDERGVLFMVDEVQTGLGRTGRWWGFQHYGVQPDVVTVAKALGNGVPIGACWARAEVAASFVPGDHASTFGGQPLAASAARATLAVMEEQNVPALAEERGNYLGKRLAALDGVGAVRGLGLLLAAELVDGRRRRGGGPVPAKRAWSSML